MSKNSARNSVLIRSVIFVCLIREKSVFTNLGPMTVFRPTFPKWKTPPVVGADKAEALAIQLAGLPVVWIGALASGRRVKFPVAVVLLKRIVSGFPDCACEMPAISHPETRRLPLNGRS